MEPKVEAVKFALKGITFPSKLDRRVKRQDLIWSLEENENVYLKRYKYKGKPAFLVTINNNGKDIDIGVVPKEYSNKLEQMWGKEDIKIEVSIQNIYSCKDSYNKGVAVKVVMTFFPDMLELGDEDYDDEEDEKSWTDKLYRGGELVLPEIKQKREKDMERILKAVEDVAQILKEYEEL